MSRYADDTTLILANDYSIFCFHIVHIFENGSGSRLNTKQTEGLSISRSAAQQTGPVKITWVKDKLKILGLYFGHANVDHANWDPRLAKLTNHLNSWKQHTLSRQSVNHQYPEGLEPLVYSLSIPDARMDPYKS